MLFGRTISGSVPRYLESKQEITNNTTKSRCRGSTFSFLEVGSQSGRSIPFALNDSRKLYFPGVGFPDSGSTLREGKEDSKINDETSTDGSTYEIINWIGVELASNR